MSFAFLSLADQGVEVTKSRRGLFGYREVTETIAEGRHTLNCMNPGWSACRTMGLITLDETTTLSNDEFATIDETVESLIRENNTSGKFVFADKAVIIYSYNVTTDIVTYKIYSVAQARSLNLI